MNGALHWPEIRVPEPWQILTWLRRSYRLVARFFGKREHRYLCALLGLGLALRLIPLDMIPFGARQFDLISGVLTNETSAGESPIPPGLAMILRLLLGWNGDPRIIAATLSILNLLSVALLYHLARRYYGSIEALLASALYATSPWGVLLSRPIGGLSLALSLAPLLLWLLHVAIQERNGKAWVVVFVFWALLFSTSYTLLPFIFAIVLLALLYHASTPRVYPLLGLLLAGMITVPWLWERFGSAGALPELLQRSMQEGAPLERVNPLTMASWVHSSAGLEHLAGTSREDARMAFPWLSGFSAGVFLCALPAGLWQLIRSWAHWQEPNEKSGYAILLAWLLVPLLSWWGWQGEIDPKAMAALQPAGYLLVGSLGARIIAWARSEDVVLRFPSADRVVLGICLLLIGWQAFSVPRFYAFAAQYGNEVSYGDPYRYWDQVIGMTRLEMADLDTNEVWLLYDGNVPEEEEAAAILTYLLADQKAILLPQTADQKTIVLPAERPVVYLHLGDPSRIDGLLSELPAPPSGVVLFPGESRRVTLQSIPSQPAAQLLAMIDRRLTARLDLGPLLVGFETQGSSGLTSYWTFADVSSAERQSEHRLLIVTTDPDGTRHTLQTSLGFPERQWKAGRLLVAWHRLPHPEELEGGFEVELAMDRLTDMTPGRVIDDKGQVVGDTIELGQIPAY